MESVMTIGTVFALMGLTVSTDIWDELQMISRTFVYLTGISSRSRVFLRRTMSPTINRSMSSFRYSTSSLLTTKMRRHSVYLAGVRAIHVCHSTTTSSMEAVRGIKRHYSSTTRWVRLATVQFRHSMCRVSLGSRQVATRMLISQRVSWRDSTITNMIDHQ